MSYPQTVDRAVDGPPRLWARPPQPAHTRPGAGLVTAREIVEMFRYDSTPLVSYRQLDYWARTGLLEPEIMATGSGSRRWYSPRQVAALRVLLPLVALGGLNRLDYTRRHPLERAVADVTAHPGLADMPVLVVTAAGDVHPLTDDVVDHLTYGGWAIRPLPNPQPEETHDR